VEHRPKRTRPFRKSTDEFLGSRSSVLDSPKAVFFVDQFDRRRRSLEEFGMAREIIFRQRTFARAPALTHILGQALDQPVERAAAHSFRTRRSINHLTGHRWVTSAGRHFIRKRDLAGQLAKNSADAAFVQSDLASNFAERKSL